MEDAAMMNNSLFNPLKPATDHFLTHPFFRVFECLYWHADTPPPGR
ncbi:hypothetical protein [Prolixibacter bellariivorans]|nr:hypothetical protein [Prolixibacter bellariivorans]